ncbi:MAG TPA: MoxR family ATPase, partial [Thermobifida alba]|nr:MoxR family ATPase [Thermobifida alba]
PLPEAQRDRFMARVSVGYPDPRAELDMIDAHSVRSPLDRLAPVATVAEVNSMIERVRRVHVAPVIKRYALDLVTATRTTPALLLGASPRATLHLVRAARAYAALDGRDYVLPDDIQALAVPVLAHRLLPGAAAHRSPADVVGELVAGVPIPTHG